MPRGPGKKENYNLDYSRFGGVSGEVDEDGRSQKKKPEPEADKAGGPLGPEGPSIEEMLAGMPRDLQEAYQLMAIARQNKDPDLERKATKLVMQGIEKGGPEVKEAFLKNVSEQMPDVGKGLRAGKTLDELEQDQYEKDLRQKGPEQLSSKIGDIRKDLESGRDATRKQMEALQSQMEQLENLQNQSPEEIMKFMSGQGMKAEDVQRIFSGDETHMQQCVQGMIDKVGVEESGTQAPSSSSAEQAVKAAEMLHTTICLDGVAEPPSEAPTEQAAPPKPKRVVPKEPEVTIPMHRFQYSKDADGKYVSVELRCSLPGVADMSAIALDVNERHLRLNTCEPAPRYAVNAGPFPVLIDANGAKAKFSKKRSELVITVPAKV